MSAANGPAPSAGGHARAAALVAGGSALILFVLTTHSVVNCEDVAEFQTLAATGGIAHAGYPAIVMLLKLFGEMPFGTLPFRANLLSAISGAFSVATAAWLGTRLAGRASAGVFAAVGLALGITFWRESTHAEVYAFTLALSTLAFLLAMRFGEHPDNMGALGLGLLAGLGLVSHPMILSLLPVAVLAVRRAVRSGRLRGRHAVFAALGLLVGLAPLAYLVAHDRPDEPMNYIQDTLRPDNAAELSGGHPPVGRLARATWLLSGRQYLAGYVFSPFDDSPRRLIGLVFANSMNEFALWGIPLALAGAWVLWRRRERAGLYLALWLAGTIFWLLYGASHIALVTIFFMSGLWVMSQLLAVALGSLAGRSRVAFVAACALVVITTLARISVAEPPGAVARASMLRVLWRFAPAEWNPFAPDSSWDAFGRGVMGSLPPRAVVLACWEEATTLRYFRHAERLRTDVDVLYHCRVPGPAFAAADSAGRPIFTTYEPTFAMTGGRPFRAAGHWRRGGLWRIE